MAERRMFAKTIIDSDAFLDMPLSAQALYFHLSMRADDDGFINNPKKIQRIVGASDDDCKLLIMKRFIITFDSGVIVIKHWKIHNYIRNDRYKPTIYQDEKAQLAEKENKSYTERLELGIPTVTQMDTQGRLEEANIVQFNKDKGSIESTCQQIADMFNRLCPSLPPVKTLSETRIDKLKVLLKTYSLDDFEDLFGLVEDSEFLTGDNHKGWKATFDWLLETENIIKVFEGNYDNVDVYANLYKRVEPI